MSLARSDNISHRRVLNIAIPIAVSNATVPLLGAVDTGVVGQMGAAAPIGAVGIGAIILTTLYWFFGFLRLGISGLTAQARGESDPYEVTALLVRGLWHQHLMSLSHWPGIMLRSAFCRPLRQFRCSPLQVG